MKNKYYPFLYDRTSWFCTESELLIAVSDDEATHPDSDGSAHLSPQHLPSLSQLASPAPLPSSSTGAGSSAEGLADGPIAQRLRPSRKPAGYYKE